MSWYDNIPGLNMVGSFFNSGKGYSDAADQMKKAWGQAQQFGQQGINYQEPFRQQGVGQFDRLNNAENNLLDPSKLLSDWMSKYEESPYAKQSTANARESGLSAANSMGLSGSSAALQNIQQSSHDIMNQDREGFLKDLMEKYKAGIGIGQNMFNQGSQTAGNMGSQMSHMGDQALGVGENLGQMAYGKANAPGDQFKDILKTMAKMYMSSQLGGLANFNI